MDTTQTGTDPFVVRLAEDADQRHVIRLVSEMWGEDVGDRHRWLYQSNPHGRALSWLAFEAATGDAVAVTSIFPRRVRVDGRDRVGSIGGDAYVLPRARRRGLATTLHRAVMADMGRLGVDFMAGPPRPNNLAALLKAGAQTVTTFQRWARPITGAGVLHALAPRAPRALARVAELPLRAFDRLTRVGTRGFEIEPVRAFGEAFDRLLDRDPALRPGSGRVAPIRDSAFLAWRYLEGPTRRQRPAAVRRRGETVGFVAFEVVSGALALVDLWSPDHAAEALELVLANARSLALGQPVHAVQMHCTHEAPLARTLARRGFVAREGHGFQVSLCDGERQRATLLSPSAWGFVDGDHDLDTLATAYPS